MSNLRAPSLYKEKSVPLASMQSQVTLRAPGSKKQNEVRIYRDRAERVAYFTLER